MTGRDGEGFLGRWSRRKQEALARTSPPDEEKAAVHDLPGDVEPGEIQEGEGGAPSVAEIEAANREAAEAVDLETLTYESDFSLFLKRGVPATLKNAALRKLWVSNPVLANVDGLNDYDQDFRLGNQLGREFKSAWQVGQGYARKLEEMEAKLAEDRAADSAVAGDPPPASESDEPQESEESEAPAVAFEQDEAPAAESAPVASAARDEEAGEAERPKVSLRRRMSFAEDR